MSHSINIPSFVTERKQDILDLGRFKRKASQNGGATRERIAMYRTRSYLRYSMSRAVRQRNKRGPFLIGKVNKDKNAMFRRHMRFPRELQCTFSNMAPPTESTVASRKNLQPTKKKQKRSDIKSPPLHLDLRSDPRPIVVLQKPGRLNTHVWHVKRFFVERQQSWYVPTKHKSRGLKAVDGLAEQCVVQDVSYLMAHQLCQGAEFHTIQVTGSASDVSSLFHQFCVS